MTKLEQLLLDAIIREAEQDKDSPSSTIKNSSPTLAWKMGIAHVVDRLRHFQRAVDEDAAKGSS